MSKNKTRGYIILIIIFIVLSVVSFAIPFSKNNVFWLAYISAVLAIIYQIYVFKLSFSGNGNVKSKFYGIPIMRVGMIYLAVQLIISLVEMGTAPFLPVWVAMVINIFPIALAVAGCIATDTVRDEIIRQDVELKRNVTNIRILQSMSEGLVSQCTDKALRKTMQNLADEFRYSDPVSSDQTINLEKDLLRQMKEIQKAVADGNTDIANRLCPKILANLAERNRICSLNK